MHVRRFWLADFLMQFVGNRVRFTTDHFAFAIEAIRIC